MNQSTPGERVDVSLFRDTAEVALFEEYEKIREQAVKLMDQKKYLPALLEIVKLRGPVDHFFNEVMVMVEDERIRRNRLAILAGVSGLFLMIADFTKILTEQ